MTYIAAIDSSIHINVDISHSVAFIRNMGQIPEHVRSSVVIVADIISPVSGIARRFVRRKCLGRVPKYTHARGPVVI